MRMRATQAFRHSYEMSWTLTAGTACAVGLLVAVRTSGVFLVAGVFLSTAVFGAMLILPWLTEPALRARLVVVGASVLGLVIVVTMGLYLAWGLASFVVVPLLLLTSPSTRDGVCRLLSGRRGRPARPVTVVALTSAPSHIPRPLPDDPGFTIPDQTPVADLCQAWRSSYLALERATSPESRLRAVEVRAIYLDELERRDGPGMQAWLSSGPRAAGDPSRWVTPTKSNDRPGQPVLAARHLKS